ncbi:MAG: pyruvate ferredoxin oxidoreductase [Euryarchaeota archaeon RBG_16_68_12]|nr:MAG: pyruvate ferredoxin oxidoreductase [Euryarchaeota archaeon RBG_16_68_12]
MGTKEIVTGNYAQSYAAKLARVDVISAYPITPQTTIVEKIAEFVAEGKLDADFIKVESEHSALQACLSASAVGARTYTATSSQGLLLMHELLFWAAGQRAPVVMGVVNRAVAPPWSIWTDHTDTMAQRDTGWIQVYCESNQEVLDTTLMAFRFAEREDVRLPAMVTEDAFYLSHTMESVDIPRQDEVDAWLPRRPRSHILEIGKIGRLGSFMGPDLYMEFRYTIAQAMEQARRAILETEAEFESRFKRSHGGFVEPYRCDGADAVLVTMGTATSTAREVVDSLREKGRKVGLAKLRVFRPFPAKEVRELAGLADRIGVLDRSYGFGYGGPAYLEVAGTLAGGPRKPLLRDFIGGLGGRDLTPPVIEGMFDALLAGNGDGDEVTWPDLHRAEEGV